MTNMTLSTEDIPIKKMQIDYYLLILLSAVAFLIWRLWRFTIAPFFRPLEPKEMPYWVPYVGHAWGFLSNYNRTLEHARRHFTIGENTEPHSLYVAGKKIYIVSSAEDAATLVRTMSNDSFDVMSRGIHLALGISHQCVKCLFTETTKFLGEGVSVKRPLDAITECHKRQLSPGREEWNNLMDCAIVPYINEALHFRGTNSHSFTPDCPRERVTISLLEMCEEIFIDGISDAFLGIDWFKSDPKWKNAWRTWERMNWKVLVGFPGFGKRDATKAAETLVDSLMQYLRLPPSKKLDAAFAIRSMETIMRNLDFGEEDMARILFLQFWAVTGNNYKVVFWAMSHIVHDIDLLSSIRQEVSPAAQDDSLDCMFIAEKCPLLSSLIDEILRITVVNGLVRDILTPTVVGGKTLMPGNKVLVPYRPLHFDRRVWGEDVELMSPKRFSRNPKLQSSKSYRPFGSGNHLCPGRFFAKRTAAYVIALLVHRYDITLVNQGATFPRADFTKPGAGVPLPYDGDDLILVLKERHSGKKEA